MNYRQWKKKYKKLHGVNPPLELDKRRQCRLARKISRVDFAAVATRTAEAITNATAAFMRGLGGAFDSAGTVCRNVADKIQPIGIKERILNWEVREYARKLYAVYEINIRSGRTEITAITYSKKAAEKIAEILENDHLEYIRRTRPEIPKFRFPAKDNSNQYLQTRTYT